MLSLLAADASLRTPLLPPQVWAQMEEDEGFFQRASELRSYSLQERVEVVKPANFSTTSGGGAGLSSASAAAGLLAPIFSQIQRWFARYEESGGAREPPVMPELLPIEVSASGRGDGSDGGMW